MSDSGPRVKTAQFVDPRIEPQPAPVYDYVIAPTQNQYYKITSSGLSNSSLNFNNLTTLGIDRAYLDTFEIELGLKITFNLGGTKNNEDWDTKIAPQPYEWTFQSFPFNSCCDEARVNINGGSFFSQPQSYVRAKERYMDQYKLSQCYENVCPIHKPILQTESGRDYTGDLTVQQCLDMYNPFPLKTHSAAVTVNGHDSTEPFVDSVTYGLGGGVPTRLGVGMYGYNQSDQGMEGGFNNAILDLGERIVNSGGTSATKQYGYRNYYRQGKTTVVLVTYREPLFVSPFSSRYDANYGRPLYNVTSLDFQFILQNLKNMIRLSQITTDAELFVEDYTVEFTSAKLCYQVMTIPTQTIQKPITTLVPYRRFVPYITDYLANNSSGDGGNQGYVPTEGAKNVTITSGVYTLNEIPTAIWVFCGPSRNILMNTPSDTTYVENTHNHDGTKPTTLFNWDSNHLFAFMKKIDITLANTTQILSTAEPRDLYRIAKANGCRDSWWSWSGNNSIDPRGNYMAALDRAHGANAIAIHASPVSPNVLGAGSVLRLKPGVDIIIPDIPLIPGANANNMVLQVKATFDIPPHSAANGQYSLWLLFEYVGVAAISPGQCEITMNPLGSGEVMNSSPVYSATSAESEGELEGSGGFWDKIKKMAGVAQQVAKDTGIVSKILKMVPNENAKKVGEWLASKGYGEPGCKRMRGGKMMGDSMDDWI